MIPPSTLFRRWRFREIVVRILTRGDMDGLTSSVLLTIVEDIKEIRFAHPKDVQDGLVEATEDDIIVNLPYVPGCGKWFDHHVSEDRKLEDIGEFAGAFAVADSAARVVYDHYKSPEFEPLMELIEMTDKLDAAKLTAEEVRAPKDWILLGLTLDPRTGLGPEFRKYFRWLVEYVKEVPIAKVLKHPEVSKRCERVLTEQSEFETFIEENSRQDENVIITDLREVNVREAPVGNRFLIYTIYPEANVEARMFKGKGGTVVIALGHSIFNRTCNVNVGKLLATYGGGGHKGAGTAQLEPETAAEKIEEIMQILKANKSVD